MNLATTPPMPSAIHDVPLLLFRQRPTLFLRLLRRILRERHGLVVPARVQVQVPGGEIKRLLSLERRADLVLVLRKNRRPWLVLIIEVQRRKDARKHRSWPLYNAALHDRYNCQVCLVVLTPTERAAAWARRPIRTVQLGSPFVPVVVGPQEVPQVTSPELAQHGLELALLSTVMYGHEPIGAAVAKATLEAASRAGDREYTSFILNVMLEVLSQKNFETLQRDKMTLLDELKLVEGPITRAWKQRGVEEGIEKGRQEGAAEGRQQALMTILDSRGLPLSARLRTRILHCTDVDTLDRWIARAVTARSAAAALE